MAELTNRRIAVLVANGFGQVELTEPVRALTASGTETIKPSPEQKLVKGWDKTRWG